MLYSLIPPILIVLSLIGIILMLVSKSKEVANLPEDHFLDREADMENMGFFGRVAWKIKSIKWDDVKHLFLRILEWIARKSRLIFLRLESRFANLSSDIRSKRQARVNKDSANPEVRTENDIIRKLKEYKADKNSGAETIEEIAAPKKKSFLEASKEVAVKRAIATEEREVKPMISDKVVNPRVRTEIKDRLEELLIERIAINPKDIEAYERLGEYYMEIKSYNDAKECFKQVIKLNPSDRNAKYRMKRLETILAKQ